jgi:hypothetical protein
MSAIDPNAQLFDDDDSPSMAAANSSDAMDTSFASVEMNGPSAPPPMGAPPPVVDDDGGTLILTVSWR